MMNTAEKLSALRGYMKKKNFAAYIVPTEDHHGSEYVGDHFKAREYMSGFTGSAGTLVVLGDRAALWTDGRYFLQADEQLKGSGITLMRAGQPGVPKIADYLRDNLGEESVIGFEGRTVTERFVRSIADKTDAKRITFDGSEDLVDLVWEDRPPVSTRPVWELEIRYAGRSREEKLADVRGKMREAGADVLVLTALDEIAWLMNLRGDDILYTPVFLAYMLIEENAARLFVHEKILPGGIRRRLEQAGITVAGYDTVQRQIRKIGPDKRVWIDSGQVSYTLMNSLPEGAEKIDAPSPVALMKAVKTPVETEHIRAAHVKDGVAVTRFMRWLKTHVGKERITELDAVKKLEAFRAKEEGYLGPSFAPIIAYGAHGAIVHYEPTEETDVEMKEGGFCLADTGGHYREGTTDVTRTFALGSVTAEEKRYYTLVLRGHLALGAARFPQGVCGQNLDVRSL